MTGISLSAANFAFSRKAEKGFIPLRALRGQRQRVKSKREKGYPHCMLLSSDFTATVTVFLKRIVEQKVPSVSIQESLTLHVM